jgi:predicted extracellular nuclease
MALGPGSIAFIGFNADGNDGFAFIAIDKIPAGTVIRFNDNEWNGQAIGAGGAFNTGEGSLTWTNGGSDLAPGTIVELLNTSSSTTRSVNIGAISGGTIALGNSDESIFSFIGTDASTPTTFLTAVTNHNGGFNDATGSGFLGGTGLVAGSTALVLPRTDGADVAAYDPATAGTTFATGSAAATAFNTTTNWVAQSASGDQDADNVVPDGPFLSDPQSPIAGVTFTIASPPTPTLSISDPTITEGNAGTKTLTFTVTASAAAPADITFDIATADGTASAGSDYVGKSLTAQTIPAGSTTYTFDVVINGDSTVEPDETVLVNLTDVTGATLAKGQGTGTITNDDVAPAATPWINEFHYDNSGTDAGEFIEIAGAAGTDLSGYSLVLYNGDAASRAVYNVIPLSGVIANQQNGFGTISFAYPVNGIQNGSPDGIALVQGGTVTGSGATGSITGGTALQFLSYEGSFTAANGPAAGQTSTDIGVSEPGDVTGQSLQLVGTGTQYSDFTWHAEQAQTSGAVNTGQNFGAAAPTVAIADASISEGDSGTKLLTFTVTRSDTSTAFTVDFSTAPGTATAGSDYVPNSGTLTFTAGGAATQQISITINGDTTQEPNETFTVNLANIQNTIGSTVISDNSATGTILNDDATITPIYTIQGTGHTSPIAGATVITQGVVTAVDNTSGGESNRGFYIQDPNGDGNAATSDGIFVFLPSGTLPTPGHLVQVTGRVQEFTPSGADAGSFSSTEISSVTSVTDLGVGPAITPVQIGGTGGLLPPTSDLVAGSLFYESLEDMLVTVKAPVAVGPTNSFGEIFTVVDNDNDPTNGIGGATGLTPRGNLLLTGGQTSFGNNDSVGGDFNPERIQVDADTGFQTASSSMSGFVKPEVNLGAHLSDVTGIETYAFANYEVLATQPYTVTQASTLVKETGTLSGNTNHLVIASYNAENLDPKVENINNVQGHDSGNIDDDVGSGKFDTIANQIFNTLHAPDILAMQEVQDEDGAEISADTSATGTLQLLVDKINALAAAAGSSVHYSFVDNPFVNNNAAGDASGGQPGGNIRTAFLYRDDRVSLVPGSLKTLAADGTPIADQGSAAADAAANSDQVNNPNNPFYKSRPPLVATFRFNGQDVTVIDNHFTSKGGSAALMGTDQPPFDAGEVTRATQAQAVNNFVDSVLGANPNAKIVVAGDLNEFQFEEPLNVLKGTASVTNYNVPGSDPITATATYTPGGSAVLTDLQDQLPANERYDYVFEGNSETLDHMLVSSALAGTTQFDIVHLNAEFADQTSDHEPLTASLLMTPVVSGQQSFTLPSGGVLAAPTGPAIIWDLGPPTTGTNATIDNGGAISATSGRAIDTTGSSNGNNHLTVINRAGASIISADDAIRINANLPNGVVSIDNFGTIRSTSGGQALDFNNITATTVSTTITNETGGIIRADGADGIRPGTNATINNHGEITGAGSGNNDGIDFQDVGFGSVHNFAGGTITGARHGITGKLPITVDNDAGATITGNLGSGINMDTGATTTTTVHNFGTITGNAAGTADGDAVDVDGLVNIDNHGVIQAFGTGTGGLTEALAIGGGSVHNFAGATIHSVQRAITVDDSDLGNAFGAVTITNEGTIQGDNGQAIAITDTFADTLTNKGVITGSVALGDGNDEVDDYAGATFSSSVDGGAGADTVNLLGTGAGSLAGLMNFETVNLQSGDWTLGSENFATLNLQAGAQTLRLAAPTLADGKYDATITGFGADDLIDLKGIGLATSAVLGANNVLTISGGTVSPVQLALDPAQSFAGEAFRLVSDNAGGTVLTIDTAPVITSPATFSVAENNTAVGTVAAHDPENDAFVFAKAGGSDQAFFTIDTHTGALSFINAPDFETAEDANHDNVYDVVVSATDTLGARSTQTIHVSVTDVVEPGKTINGTNGNDHLTGTTGPDTIDGGNGNDIIDAGDGNDKVTGGNGNDTISGGRGNDIIDGGNGDDIIDGGSGNNQLTGGNGNDVMRAGDGNNSFDGGNGDDVMTAGNGNNTFTGGNGNDTFAFGPGFGQDVVTDFTRGDQIEFDGGVFGNFQAVQAATHQVDADTVISLGTGHTITLQHVTASSLRASDFVFTQSAPTVFDANLANVGDLGVSQGGGTQLVFSAAQDAPAPTEALTFSDPQANLLVQWVAGNSNGASILGAPASSLAPQSDQTLHGVLAASH